MELDDAGELTTRDHSLCGRVDERTLLWKLAKPILFQPVPINGKLRLWDLDPLTAALVDERTADSIAGRWSPPEGSKSGRPLCVREYRPSSELAVIVGPQPRTWFELAQAISQDALDNELVGDEADPELRLDEKLSFIAPEQDSAKLYPSIRKAIDEHAIPTFRVAPFSPKSRSHFKRSGAGAMSPDHVASKSPEVEGRDATAIGEPLAVRFTPAPASQETAAPAADLQITPTTEREIDEGGGARNSQAARGMHPSGERLAAFFGKWVENNGGRGVGGQVAAWIAEGSLDPAEFAAVIAQHGSLREAWIRETMLDLVVAYANHRLGDGPPDVEGVSDLRLLQLALHVGAGDLFAHRRTEIARIVQAQFHAILADGTIDAAEDLYLVELQAAFSLSFDQLMSLARPALESAIVVLRARAGNEGDSTSRRVALQRIAALEPELLLATAGRRLSKAPSFSTILD